MDCISTAITATAGCPYVLIAANTNLVPNDANLVDCPTCRQLSRNLALNDVNAEI